MEAGDGAAGDGDEEKRKDLARNDGTAAVHILREGREAKRGVDEQDAGDERGDGAQLDVGGEIVARLEQHPDGKGAGEEAISAEEEHDVVIGEDEMRRERGSGYPVSGDERDGRGRRRRRWRERGREHGRECCGTSTSP